MYVLEDCYVADLPPSSGGLLTPILHAFTGYRSPSNPTLVNVDVVVRHGNVVPIVHIESIIPGLAGVQVANISVTVVGLRATWPVGTEQAVVDTIFSILEAPFVNVSLTLQSCVLNLSLSASASGWKRPVFVLLRPPPIPSLSSTNATLMIIDSSIVTLSAAGTRGDLFAFEVPSNVIITNVLVDMSNSTVVFQAAVWREYLVAVINFVGSDDYVGGIGRTSNTTVSGVLLRITNSSSLSSTGILPKYKEPPQFPRVSAAIMYISATRCSHVEVVIANDCRFTVTLVRSLILPSPSPFFSTGMRLIATVVELDIAEVSSHVRLQCINATVIVTSTGRAHLLRVGSKDSATRFVDIALTDVIGSATVTIGNSGEVGKSATCIGLEANKGMRNVTIAMLRCHLRHVAAVDGGVGNAISAVALTSNSGISMVFLTISTVVLEATMATGTVSSTLVAGSTIVMFAAVTSLLVVNGNIENFETHVVNSQVLAKTRFQCPSASLRFTSAAGSCVSG
jgi:hypothetical protein